jgi:hypothetical protein
MSEYPDLSFLSYDRMFPAQDFIDRNAVGNLIALPLNGQKIEENKTIFVTDDFEPIANSFEYLNSKHFIKYNQILEIIGKLDEFSELGNFNKSIAKNVNQLKQKDFNDNIKITVSNEIYFPLESISNKAKRFLKRLSSFVNKQYYINERKHISNYQVPRIYSLFIENIQDKLLILPRGCLEQILQILRTLKVNYFLDVKINNGNNIEVEFNGKLKK